MDPLFQIPDDLTALSEDELRSLIASSVEVAKKVAADHSEFISEGRSASDLMAEMNAGVAAIQTVKAELAKREAAAAEVTPEVTPEEAPAEPAKPEAEAASEVDAEALAALAAEAAAETPAADPAEAVEPENVQATGLNITEIVAASTKAAVEATLAAVKPAEGEETVTASAKLRPPARARSAEPVVQDNEPPVALTAALENFGPSLGEEIDGSVLADMMVRRRDQFGHIAEGTHGDQVPVGRASWKDRLPEDRLLGKNMGENLEKIEAVVASAEIRRRFQERREEAGDSLVASGGLCAPVTPYYQLQMLSVAERPVRAALPSFSADRGGLRYARPAALTAITTGVGAITEAQDALGGTNSQKTCQVIACPAFTETDVTSIYHCLEFGNLGARAFPELVAQWNALTLAAHARKADGLLLDGIRTASTAVTASDTLGLGASAQLPSQIITAAAGMRSRHRMEPDTVLRVMLPDWVLDLFVSDMYRTQFQRFDMSGADFVALLRANNVEPTFYLDTATSRNQIAAAQAAGALNTYPTTVEWYLYPEGSFLYLDGGTLELGLVRDSVLNGTNDFQIFGETWENVAFIGVESLAVTTTIDDRGAVVAPKASAATSYA